MLALGPVIQKERAAYVAASHFHSHSQAAYIAGAWLNLIMLRGLMSGRHVPKPVSWDRRQGSPQEDGQMAPSPPAALSGTCLLDWSRFFTQPSCISQQAVPAYSSFFMSQGWWPVPPSVGAEHQLLLYCITCTALLGESGSEAQPLSSSPPLTTVSPLTHDWQQQAGGNRPAGHKPALGLAWIHWKRPAEGLAEKSLTGGTAPFPLPK